MVQTMATTDSDFFQLTQDGGVTKKIVRQGREELGSPPKGSKVYVHYVGTLASDGSQFDSSRSREKPFSFKLGEGSVIKGWDVGIASMKKGELAILTCQPDYAYGKSGSSQIPPDSVLNFEVELLYWIDGEDLSGDGKLVKKVLSEGSGYKSPKDGEPVVVELEVRKGDTLIREKAIIESILNRDNALPKGVVECVKKMKIGEVSLLSCSKEYLCSALDLPEVANDERIDFEVKLVSWKEVVVVNEGVRKVIDIPGEGYSTPGISSNVKITYQPLPDGCIKDMEFPLMEGHLEIGVEEALKGMKKGEKATITVQPTHREEPGAYAGSLIVQIQLIDFQKEKDSWELTPSEKVTETIKIKEKASEFYRNGKFALAKHHYERCVQLIDAESKWNDDKQENEAKHIQLLCTSNLSMCQLKLKMYKEAIKNCDKVLEKEADNVKALFRRAQAYFELSEDSKAEMDLKRAKEIDPQNTAVSALLQKVLQEIKKQDERHKAIFSKAFVR